MLYFAFILYFVTSIFVTRVFILIIVYDLIIYQMFKNFTFCYCIEGKKWAITSFVVQFSAQKEMEKFGSIHFAAHFLCTHSIVW